VHYLKQSGVLTISLLRIGQFEREPIETALFGEFRQVNRELGAFS
jgi:hypothetical protein